MFEFFKDIKRKELTEVAEAKELLEIAFKHPKIKERLNKIVKDIRKLVDEIK